MLMMMYVMMKVQLEAGALQRLQNFRSLRYADMLDGEFKTRELIWV